MNAKTIQNELQILSNPEHAVIGQRFFKTGKGEYGEGDVFRGIRVPVLRKLSKKYQDLSRSQTARLLRSRFHEDRLLALLILVLQFRKADETGQGSIYDLYTENTRHINNWDLVDTSAEHIVGAYLKDKDKSPLNILVKSPSLWERRIAVMATFHYIKKGRFDETLYIAEYLLQDPEDLIHKAVGWMLREVGNRDLKREEVFLKKHYRNMPRTMLRYAIEKFPEARRQGYLKGTI